MLLTIFMEKKGTMRYTRIFIFLMILVSVSITGCATTVSSTSSEVSQVEVDSATMAEAEAAPSQAEESGAWEVVLQTEVEQPVRMAAFLDENFGLTGGANSAGRVHVTTDGGQAWTMAESSLGCVFALDIVDVQTIWQCNASDVGRSTDGGQTWQSESTGSGQPYCQMSAADGEVAWYLSPTSLQGTVDGGTTWVEIAMPEDVLPENIAAVSLRTADEGYLLTFDAALYVTQDGGGSWSLLPLDLAGYEGLMLLPSNLAAAAIRFFDADNGLVTLSLVGKQSMVVALRTFDGGQTWQGEVVPAETGALHLTHDGSLLTVHSIRNTGVITVLEYR
jgi:photosystem II stability/assembly factor-like uncharacterized protein